MAVCYEAKERKIDARLRTTKNRSRTRWNMVRIIQGRKQKQRRYLAIVCRNRKVNVGQAPTGSSLPIPRRKKIGMLELLYGHE